MPIGKCRADRRRKGFCDFRPSHRTFGTYPPDTYYMYYTHCLHPQSATYTHIHKPYPDAQLEQGYSIMRATQGYMEYLTDHSSHRVVSRLSARSLCCCCCCVGLLIHPSTNTRGYCIRCNTKHSFHGMRCGVGDFESRLFGGAFCIRST